MLLFDKRTRESVIAKHTLPNDPGGKRSSRELPLGLSPVSLPLPRMPRPVSKHLKPSYVSAIRRCLPWMGKYRMKSQDRDRFIGWDETTKMTTCKRISDTSRKSHGLTLSWRNIRFWTLVFFLQKDRSTSGYKCLANRPTRIAPCCLYQQCFYHLFTELIKVGKHNQPISWKRFRRKLSRLLKDATGYPGKRQTLARHAFLGSKKDCIADLNSFWQHPVRIKTHKDWPSAWIVINRNSSRFWNMRAYVPIITMLSSRYEKRYWPEKPYSRAALRMTLRHRPSSCLFFALRNYRELIP